MTGLISNIENTVDHFIVTEQLTYMVNERGHMILMYEDNIFYINKRYESTTFWQCMEYRKLRCPCRCKTTNNGIVRRSMAGHNHSPNKQKIQDRISRMKHVTASLPL